MPTSTNLLALGVRHVKTAGERSLKQGLGEIKKLAREAATKLSAVDAATAELDSRFSAVAGGAKLAAVGIKAVAGAAAGAATAMLVAIAAAARFEQGLIGVGKTADLEGAALQGLGESIDAMTRRLPNSADELLGIAQAAGQLGIKGEANILAFTETIAKLGSASDLAGEEAATALARILTVTGESAASVKTLASVIVSLGNNFAETERGIARHAGEIARATAVYEIGSAQAAALGTTLAAFGVQAELSGSAVGRSFRVIESAVKSGGKELDALAKVARVSGENLRAAYGRSTVEAFNLFLLGLRKTIREGGNVAEQLKTVKLQGEEVLKVLPVLASQFDTLAKAQQLAAAETTNATALDVEAEKALAALSSQWAVLQNKVASATRAIGVELLPVAKETVAQLSRWLDQNRELATDIGKFAANTLVNLKGGIAATSDVVKFLADNFVLLGAAVVAVKFEAIILGVEAFTVAVSALTTAMLANPLIAGAAVLAAGILLVANAAKQASERMAADIATIAESSRELDAAWQDVTDTIAGGNAEKIQSAIDHYTALLLAANDAQMLLSGEIQRYERNLTAVASGALEATSEETESWTRRLLELKQEEGEAAAATRVLDQMVSLLIDAQDKAAASAGNLSDEIADTGFNAALTAEQIKELDKAYRDWFQTVQRGKEVIDFGPLPFGDFRPPELPFIPVEFERRPTESELERGVSGVDVTRGLAEEERRRQREFAEGQARFAERARQESAAALQAGIQLLGEMSAMFGRMEGGFADMLSQLAAVSTNIGAGVSQVQSGASMGGLTGALGVVGGVFAIFGAVMDFVDAQIEARKRKEVSVPIEGGFSREGGFFGLGVGSVGIPQEQADAGVQAFRDFIDSITEAMGGILESFPRMGIAVRRDGEEFTVTVEGVVFGVFESWAEAFDQAAGIALSQAEFTGLGPNLEAALANAKNIGGEAFLEIIPFLREVDNVAQGVGPVLSEMRDLMGFLDVWSRRMIELGASVQDVIAWREEEIRAQKELIEEGFQGLIPGFSSQIQAFRDLTEASEDFSMALVEEEQHRQALLDNVSDVLSDDTPFSSGGVGVGDEGGPRGGGLGGATELVEQLGDTTREWGTAVKNAGHAVDDLEGDVAELDDSVHQVGVSVGEIDPELIERARAALEATLASDFLSSALSTAETFGVKLQDQQQLQADLAEFQFTLAVLELQVRLEELRAAKELLGLSDAMLDRFGQALSDLEGADIDFGAVGRGSGRGRRQAREDAAERFAEAVAAMERELAGATNRQEAYRESVERMTELAEEGRIGVDRLNQALELLGQLAAEEILEPWRSFLESRGRSPLEGFFADLAASASTDLADLFAIDPEGALGAAGTIGEAFAGMLEEYVRGELDALAASGDVEGLRDLRDALAALPLDLLPPAIRDTVQATIAMIDAEVELAAQRIETADALTDFKESLSAIRQGVEDLRNAGLSPALAGLRSTSAGLASFRDDVLAIGSALSDAELASILETIAGAELSAQLTAVGGLLGEITALGVELPVDVAQAYAMATFEVARAQVLAALASADMVAALAQFGVEAGDLVALVAGATFEGTQGAGDVPRGREANLSGVDPRRQRSAATASDAASGALDRFLDRLSAIEREAELAGLDEWSAEIARINDRWDQFVEDMSAAGASIDDVARAEAARALELEQLAERQAATEAAAAQREADEAARLLEERRRQLEAFLRPLEALERDLLGGALGGVSPRDALEFAQQRFSAARAGTDSAEFAAAARGLLEAQERFGGRGGAFAALQAEILEASAAFRQVAGIDLGGGAAQGIPDPLRDAPQLIAQMQTQSDDVRALTDTIARLADRLEQLEADRDQDREAARRLQSSHDRLIVAVHELLQRISS